MNGADIRELFPGLDNTIYLNAAMGVGCLEFLAAASYKFLLGSRGMGYL